MIRHSIFSEETQKAVASASAVFRCHPYFLKNYGWCKELLLNRKAPDEAAKAVRLGIRHAQALRLDAGMLPVVYIDWMLPEIFEESGNRGIRKEVFLDSMKDIEIWIKVFRKYHEDRTGLDRIEWVFKSLSGKVRRFGSLQFEEVTYEFPCLIFENRRTGSYAALAAPSLKVDQDGYISGTNGRPCERERETFLSFDGGRVTGFPSDPEQGIIRMEEASTLSLSEWEPVLVPGEKAVAVHIPAGADLSPEKIDLALTAGKEFYEGDLLVCDSWLLDPHLKYILPEKSRILDFMNRFYKMPVKATAPQILERVMGFDFSMDSLGNYPCTTSLQKALKNYLLEGKEMFTTAGFLPWK
ncbi:acyltransferase domain-containing protein [Lachnospiraceae bacterium 54-53]